MIAILQISFAKDLLGIGVVDCVVSIVGVVDCVAVSGGWRVGLPIDSRFLLHRHSL